jgi:hypothetical protein
MQAAQAPWWESLTAVRCTHRAYFVTLDESGYRQHLRGNYSNGFSQPLSPTLSMKHHVGQCLAEHENRTAGTPGYASAGREESRPFGSPSGP